MFSFYSARSNLSAEGAQQTIESSEESQIVQPSPEVSSALKAVEHSRLQSRLEQLNQHHQEENIISDRIQNLFTSTPRQPDSRNAPVGRGMSPIHAPQQRSGTPNTEQINLLPRILRDKFNETTVTEQRQKRVVNTTFPRNLQG